MINGRAGLACHTHLEDAKKGGRDGVIEVEPFNNMPVIKDLVVDMDAVHWKKIQRVTPWLINKEPVPEREYIVPHENMVDVTQSMACIQCGACVARACRWRSTRCSSARPRWPRPTALSATRATPSSTSA